jgi:hypothetical protein
MEPKPTREWELFRKETTKMDRALIELYQITPNTLGFALYVEKHKQVLETSYNENNEAKTFDIFCIVRWVSEPVEIREYWVLNAEKLLKIARGK